MLKINQTSYGGLDCEIENQGNCFQACVASIFELPLEEAFDCRPYPISPEGSPFEEDSWFIAFNKWLGGKGFGCIWLEWTPPTVTKLLGYHIAQYKSPTLKARGDHAVVLLDGCVEHDPNSRRKADVIGEDLIGVYLLVGLNPASFTKNQKFLID